MVTLYVSFVALSAVIVAAAMLLAKFGDEISDQTGLGGSVTGLVLLAGATSLPELSVGYSAIQLPGGGEDLTAGGVLGSSLVNLLILALVDLISRKPGHILTRSAAEHALSATVGALLTGLILLGILLDNPWKFWSVGPCSWAVIIAYAFCARLIYLDERQSAEDRESDEGDEKVEKSVRKLLLSFGGFIAATAVIFVVAPLLASRADEIAADTGLGQTFIGTLLVATVTSLPEAVSTIAAVRMGAVDMAIGNIFGSNAFNMVIFAVLDFATPGSILDSVSETHAITAACVLITTAIGLMCILYKPAKRWWLFEPDAALIAMFVVLALYLVYLNGLPGGAAAVAPATGNPLLDAKPPALESTPDED